MVGQRDLHATGWQYRASVQMYVDKTYRCTVTGCDVVEAAAITGHASLKELQRYIETRDRRKAARRAMDKLISGTEVANPIIRLANQEKKA